MPAWLTATSTDPGTGDRKTDVVYLWDNDGRVGIARYAPDGPRGNCSYHEDLANPNLGQGPDAIRFFTADSETV